MSLAIVGVFVFLATVYGTVVTGGLLLTERQLNEQHGTRTWRRLLPTTPHDRPCPSTDLRRLLTHSERRDATAEPGPPRCGPDHRRAGCVAHCGTSYRAQAEIGASWSSTGVSSRPTTAVWAFSGTATTPSRTSLTGRGIVPVPRWQSTPTLHGPHRRSHTALVHTGRRARLRPGDLRRGPSTTQRAFRDPGHPRTPQRASCGRRRTPEGELRAPVVFQERAPLTWRERRQSATPAAPALRRVGSANRATMFDPHVVTLMDFDTAPSATPPRSSTSFPSNPTTPSSSTRWFLARSHVREEPARSRARAPRSAPGRVTIERVGQSPWRIEPSTSAGVTSIWTHRHRRRHDQADHRLHLPAGLPAPRRGMGQWTRTSAASRGTGPNSCLRRPSPPQHPAPPSRAGPPIFERLFRTSFDAVLTFLDEQSSSVPMPGWSHRCRGRPFWAASAERRRRRLNRCAASHNGQLRRSRSDPPRAFPAPTGVWVPVTHALRGMAAVFTETPGSVSVAVVVVVVAALGIPHGAVDHLRRRRARRSVRHVVAAKARPRLPPGHARCGRPRRSSGRTVALAAHVSVSRFGRSGSCDLGRQSRAIAVQCLAACPPR